MQKINNLREIFDVIIANNPKRIAYKIREGEGVRDIFNPEFYADVRGLAAYIILKNKKCCAVIGENSYKQQICYYAAIYAGAVVVPVDKELTPKEMTYIIKTAKCDLIMCGDTHDDVLEDIIEELKDVESFLFASDKSRKVKEGWMESFIEKGKEYVSKNINIFDHINVEPTDVCQYVFTSGTTGTSKGVMLSHKNILSVVKSCDELKAVSTDVMAILPMHHTLQSTLGCTYVHYINSTISINNSIKHIVQNMGLFKPTDFICVPLVVETLHDKIWSSVREAGKEKAFKKLTALSKFLMRFGIDVRKVLFKKIHKTFGGSMKSFFCGGAPLNKDVASNVHAWGFDVYIGYGITECAPLITRNTSNKESKFGSCGIAISCNKFKVYNPDENGDGEIWIKGDNVMLGYLDNPEATEEVMQDGWYKTGDVGKLDKDGFLYITGRMKNLIVLSNGKNIYPEEVEEFLYKIPEIKEVVVFGEKNEVGQEIGIAAEIFPNFDYAEAKGIKDIQNVISKSVDALNESLPYYKRISNVIYRDVEFKKTTTKKIKRH